MWINNIRRLLCFWACATLPAVAAASPKPVVLTAAGNGSTVHLRQAGILIVRLPSNGTTGY
jgi:predicted secreted protein